MRVRTTCLSLARWGLFLPGAFVASVAAGAAVTIVGESFGGSSWYVWSVSGAASAWAFFYVSLHVTPIASITVKWIAVTVVGCLGLMSGLGPLLAGVESVRAFAGATMVGAAIYFARMPVTAIKAELADGSKASGDEPNEAP